MQADMIGNRFSSKEIEGTADVLITDVQTGRTATVGLGCSGAVFKVLAELFATTDVAEPAAEASVADTKPRKSKTPEKAAAAAKPKKTKATSNKKGPAATPKKPELPERPGDMSNDEITENGFKLVFEPYPEGNKPAYRIVKDDRNVGWIVYEGPKKYRLCDPDNDRFAETVHRDVLGASIKFDVTHKSVV